MFAFEMKDNKRQSLYSGYYMCRYDDVISDLPFDITHELRLISAMCEKCIAAFTKEIPACNILLGFTIVFWGIKDVGYELI